MDIGNLEDAPCGMTRGPNTIQQTNMTIEKQLCEDVSPIKHADFPLSCLVAGG